MTEAPPAVVPRVDIMTLFCDAWIQFVRFVHENSHYILDPKMREKLCKGIDRDPALALVVLAEKLTPEIKKEIGDHDEKALRTRFADQVDMGDLELPEDVIERAFTFGELFCLLVNELQE